MKLADKMGKRNMVLTKIIIKNDFPNEFHAIYETKDVYSLQENYFKEIGPNKTKWKRNSKFKFSSFVIKLIGFIMLGSFKKQSNRYAMDFKTFLEDGTSVAN